MGKDKQRTKGGVKPSSSGRTAELLLKSQNVGFDNSSAFSSYVPIITFGSGDFDSQDSKLSPEMRLVLRKLGKKDATTKIKALGELTELFAQTPDLCMDVLQYWPRIYSRLATDDSRKVRELCHGALEIIGKQVGRNLAPQLKSIFPYWFLSQSDIFAPASSSANNAFKNIFTTEKKQMEAVSFCREEILALIVESLKNSHTVKKQGKEKKESKPQDDSSCGNDVDSENYELRMIYSSLISLTKLVELNVVEEEQIQLILDSEYFWTLTKHSSSAVRRHLFNLITTIANWKPCMIQRQCIKAITQSLREETSECLQSLWNCFLTLTLNCEIFTTDPNLTKAQLLKVCKKGFYGNASSLGPAILPLVAKIGIEEALVRDLLPALQTGYSNEKSTLEKTSILRAYGEILAYYLSTADSSLDIAKLLVEVAFPFLDILISATGTSREFGRTIGCLIKKEEFYLQLSRWLTNKDPDNYSMEKACGHFIISLCSNKGTIPSEKRNVKFMCEDDQKLQIDSICYKDLPTSKTLLVTQVATFCLKSNSLETFAILSSYFQCDTFYNDLTDNNPITIIDSNAIHLSSDSEVKLILVLDLIRTFPTLPPFLSKLSNIFESDYKTLEELRRFVGRISSLVNIPAVTRWLKQDLFCNRVKTLIDHSEDLINEEAIAVVKFLIENSSVFGQELLENLITAISVHLKSVDKAEDRFLQDVLRLLRAMKDQSTSSKLRPIILILWDRLLHFHTLPGNIDQEGKYHIEFLTDELIRSLPQFGMYPTDLYGPLEQAVDQVSSVGQIEVLVELSQSLVPEGDKFPTTPPFTSIRFDKARTEDLLNFLHLSHPPINNSLITYPENFKEHLKSSFLSRSIFEAKVALVSNVDDSTDLVTPVLKVLYAQAVVTFWKDVEKYDMFKNMPEELAAELNIVTTRWLEILAENKWTKLREEVLDELLKPNRDPILSSKLPLQVFLRTARKMDLVVSFVGRSKNLHEFIMDDSVSLENEKAQEFLQSLLQNYFMEDQVFDITPVIDYLNIQRKDYSEEFYFERIFAHLEPEKKQKLIKLLDVVIRVLEKIREQEDDKDEFFSIATCWVSAWLKQCKNIPAGGDKLQLMWIGKLSNAVSLIAQHARSTASFTTEYMEFHAANLYLPLYYLFLQLVNLTEDFLAVRTIENVSVALSSVPSTTLAFIEPSSSKICSNFVPSMENKRLPVKIMANRLVKKVKPKLCGGQEAEDLPIVPLELNEIIRKYGEELISREIEDLKDDAILTYLLSWDALLTMHADRSFNEFGSFSKEPHLLPQLLSILFFQLIDLIPEQKFNGYFENPPVVQPDEVPPNISHLTCSVLLKALQCLPYPTRWWWNSQLSKQRDKLMVEKFIGKFLSSRLAAEELRRVQWEESDNVTVYSHPGCNELIAHYKIEDTTVTLTVTLPLNHPLGPISVKISDKKLLGKITSLLNNRSNSLAAGLQMWKENLDAKYSGHEECAICFFILHGSTKSLPKMACKTCNHKFHSACLYKWFTTSNKSECPLCRNLF